MEPYLKTIVTMCVVYIAVSVASLKSEWVNNVSLKVLHVLFYLSILYTAMDGLMAGR